MLAVSWSVSTLSCSPSHTGSAADQIWPRVGLSAPHSLCMPNNEVKVTLPIPGDLPAFSHYQHLLMCQTLLNPGSWDPGLVLRVFTPICLITFPLVLPTSLLGWSFATKLLCAQVTAICNVSHWDLPPACLSQQ
jgi:hypothetical protein